MTPDKIDFPPLLPGGVHRHDPYTLRDLTVDPFALSIRRPNLFTCLEVYLDLLSLTGIRARIWVAGSFVTEKLNPDDVDLVVIFDADSVNQMRSETKKQIDLLLDAYLVQANFGLHIDSVLSSNEKQIAYYYDLFGTLRDEVTPKGIAELRINHD